MSERWHYISEHLERLLRLRTFPIGFKLESDRSQISTIKQIRTPTRKVLLCQVISVARFTGWTICVTRDSLLEGSPCAAMIGFEERREIVKNGTYRAAIWFESKREGLKCEEEFPHLPAGRFSAAFLGPLRANKFEPDIVLIYGTPAQMIIIINAIQWKDYKRVEVSCTGESSCADYIAGCYLSKKPIVTIPCYGERVYAHTQEDEMVIGIPADQIEKVVNGLQNLSKRGVRYPIPFSGPQLEVVNNLPPLYRDIYGIEDKPLFEFWNDKKVK